MDDRDDLPDVALGRVPAPSAADALTLLAKIGRYEREAPPGAWRRRVVYAAGEGRFGFADGVLEWLFRIMIDRLVPAAFDVSVTYAKPTSIYCPPPSRLTDAMLERLGEGALLYNYVGHGDARGLDAFVWGGRRYDMLGVRDLTRLPPAGGRHAIALLACCSTGWFDLPGGRPSLGEALLFHPDGPVAVIAGSRVTHPYGTAILQKDVTRLLLVERVATVGALDLRATRSMLRIDAADRELDLLAWPLARAGKWASTLWELRRMHVGLYNLLGDPATRIALPPPSTIELAVAGDAIAGRVPGIVRGQAIVTIETGREGTARPDLFLAVDGATDPELDRKATHNYPLANERSLARFEVPVVEGRFTVDLEGPLPPRAAIIKAHVRGVDAAGAEVEAIGAARVPTARSSPAG